MFRPAEIEALIVGARMVAAWGGRTLAEAASEALVRIAAVVPPERMHRAERVPIFASALRFQDGERASLDRFAKAIADRLKTRFAYRDADGTASERLVWPLALHFWGQVWTLAAWCELRDDFRTFRIDRAEWVTVTDEAYPNVAGRTLQEYLERATKCDRIERPFRPTTPSETVPMRIGQPQG